MFYDVNIACYQCGADEKARRHVAVYGHATWQCVGVHKCVRALVHASVCTRAGECEEIHKPSFSG